VGVNRVWGNKLKIFFKGVGGAVVQWCSGAGDAVVQVMQWCWCISGISSMSDAFASEQ
jgi:hypothetical protein